MRMEKKRGKRKILIRNTALRCITCIDKTVTNTFNNRFVVFDFLGIRKMLYICAKFLTKFRFSQTFYYYITS